MIMAATPDTFGFDCVNLIKSVLWGWTGDKTKSYGGAKYATNGVPDEGADTMIKRCKDATASGWDKVDPGEVVWTTGHIGVYIGNGLAVECSPRWTPPLCDLRQNRDPHTARNSQARSYY